MNEALRLADALRESHPYPMHVRLAADELVWLFEARERDKVAFKQLQAQRDALLEALKLASAWVEEYISQMRAYTISEQADDDLSVIYAAIAAVEEGK